jgi:oxygen-independent coproporphyrinogen-3 oxidase
MGRNLQWHVRKPDVVLQKISVAGIYIHIPFCKQACNYCDFHFSTNRTRQNELVAAINTELHLQSDYLGHQPVRTVYFGGGTPSLLTAEQLRSILLTTGRTYSPEPGCEITLEANPDDLTAEKLAHLKEAGINRLSIGIQSFNDDLLKLLNRSHDARLAVGAFGLSREAGFENINVDLIYAIPGLSLAAWKANIHRAVALGPDHISAYTLTIEPATVFGRLAAMGKFQEIGEDVAANQMETLQHLLLSAGYEQYEISNFCKPGFQSRHNSSYWNQDHYLGVGPAAHSYNGISRQFNISNNHLYLKSICEGHVPFQVEMLSGTDRINEYVLISLRTSKGCDLEKMKSEFNFDLVAGNATYLESLVSRQLASLDNTRLQLTPAGRLLADKIAADLFVTRQMGEEHME